ncbi:MAG: hypothetical protein P1Q69_17335, partial [Candidatus Thorarchaeota archaeon]|nr:hypothetical protein [Candidatus Thorarchaeota archaeon]
MTAIQNLFMVSSIGVVVFLLSSIFILVLKRNGNRQSLRLIKRKYMLVPALVFLLMLVVAPQDHIGPPPDMMTNAIISEYRNSLSEPFNVSDVEPYLPRVRVEYYYYMSFPEICECILFVYQGETVIQNVSVELYQASDYNPSMGHATFNLPPGNYQVHFAQQLYTLDGTPRIGGREIHVHLEQIQDLQWVEEDFYWKQYYLLLFITGFGLLMSGIWVTDHSFDTEDE